MAWLSMSVAKTCTLKLCFIASMPLGKQDGDGIGLLAGGAARRPDADRAPARLAGEEPGDDLLLEGLERLRIAEEIGHADQQVAKERLHLRRRLLQILDVVLRCVPIWWTAMRRSMRRWMVLGLYWEKSWPVWARSRTKIFFSALSALGTGAVQTGRPCRRRGRRRR